VAAAHQLAEEGEGLGTEAFDGVVKLGRDAPRAMKR